MCRPLAAPAQHASLPLLPLYPSRPSAGALRFSCGPVRWILLILLLAVCMPVLAQQPLLETARLRIGDIRVQVELARTDEQRQIGLMYRRHLDEDSGMLFVFDAPQTLNFWMKNTLIPLDIAYIDAEGVIVDIQQMMPLSLEGHRSRAPAQYALEVRQGWFAARGIKPGVRVTLPEGLSPR